jgi:beta-lactamase class A
MRVDRKTQARGRVMAGLIVAMMLFGCKSDGAVGSVARIAPPPAAYHVAMPVPPVALAPKPPQALAATIHSLADQFGGRVGIAVQSVNDGWTAQSHGDLHLPQQSVSKMWVAITMLDLRDQGKLHLSDPITITMNDLTLFHQPVASLVKGDGYHTTLGQLEFRALTTSDNTANDRILNYVGGPQAVRAMIARKNLGEIRFGPGERLLQSATAGLTWQPSYSLGDAFEQARDRLPMATREAAFDAYVADPMDGAEPDAIVDALARLVKGQLLSPESTKWLLDTMHDSRTGWARLRRVLPADWEIMHKTGTGQDLERRTAGFNDVGILTAPDGRQYTVAVMIGDGEKSERDRQKLIQDVASAVIADDHDHAMAIAQQDARSIGGHGAN